LDELALLTAREGVRKIAVENFCGTLEGMTYGEAMANMEMDARLYNWRPTTKNAIKVGISWAMKATTKHPVRAKKAE
jgi:hypothetical protein